MVVDFVVVEEAGAVIIIGMYSIVVVVSAVVVVFVVVEASGNRGGNVTPDIEDGIVKDPFRPKIGNCGTAGTGRGETTGTRLPREEFGTS
jgi:hypothetical protein